MASRHWAPEAVSEGVASLRAKGWIDGEPPTITDAGVKARVAVEDATDVGEAAVLDVLSEEERNELFATLKPMAATIVAGGGYPADPNERTLPGVDD
jgi:hypothetical protein